MFVGSSVVDVEVCVEPPPLEVVGDCCCCVEVVGVWVFCVEVVVFCCACVVVVGVCDC
jgi:hypothetical protein